MKRPASYSPAPVGTPTWWERRANKQYSCSACRDEISTGERYLGCRTLSPGIRGPYGHRGTYRTQYYHIICILSITHKDAGSDIGHASSEIVQLQTQIASLKDTSLQCKKQIGCCGAEKHKAEEEYESARSLRKLGRWINYKYTLWSKNSEIRNLEKKITQIENKEIPYRENRISDLSRRIARLKLWQEKLEMESQEFAEAQ